MIKFMSDDEKPPPPHILTPEETQTIKQIIGLLQSGGKITEGNHWINDPKEGGYFLVIVELKDKPYPFKLSVPFPFPIGPTEF